MSTTLGIVLGILLYFIGLFVTVLWIWGNTEALTPRMGLIAIFWTVFWIICVGWFIFEILRMFTLAIAVFVFPFSKKLGNRLFSKI